MTTSGSYTYIQPTTTFGSYPVITFTSSVKLQPKYVVQGGYVISKRDGQGNYVSGSKLIKLYGVDPKDCVDISNQKSRGVTLAAGQIYLTPRYDGNYSIPIPISSLIQFTLTSTTVKLKETKLPSPKHLYRCGQCGYEKSITLLGVTRHWRKCVRDYDNG